MRGIGQYLKLPANSTSYLFTATATAGGLVVYSSCQNSDLPSFSSGSFRVSSTFTEYVRDPVLGFIRSSRAISTFAFAVADYKYSLSGLLQHSEEYRHRLSEVHLRSAERLLKLCQMNKGFYVKAGQFVASMGKVPKEYSSLLSSLQDQAVPCSFKTIEEVLINNLGSDLSEIFLSFEEQPVAAASIAQVHRAILRNRQEVAVKVQYPGLERQMKIDIMTMSFLSKIIAWIFPEFRFEWLASEFTKAIHSELDFIQEAKNSEKTSKHFKNNKMVKVPHVYWEWTTSKVLVMQFCRGCKVDDVEFMKQMRISPEKVAKILVEVFAEMIFIHGFLHGDPHPGNVLVSPEGHGGFSLVLLDHGIYRQFDEDFRLDYCQLWKALILLDANTIQQVGGRFGVGKYSRYFPLIFTGRTIESKSVFGSGMSIEEKKNLKEEIKLLKMEDISSFMETLPPDLLTVMRTDGLLSSIIRKLGASQTLRMLTYAKYALHGLSLNLNHESDFGAATYSRLKANLSYLHLRIVLGKEGRCTGVCFLVSKGEALRYKLRPTIRENLIRESIPPKGECVIRVRILSGLDAAVVEKL